MTGVDAIKMKVASTKVQLKLVWRTFLKIKKFLVP
jgi:hypothetical protein